MDELINSLEAKRKRNHVDRMKCVFSTTCEMLERRCYNVSDQRSVIEDFDASVVVNGEVDRRKMHFICRKDGELLFVFFSSIKTIGVKVIEQLMEKLKSQDISRCVVVYAGNLTSSATRLAHKLSASKPVIELFSEYDLLFDIMNHELMPAITKLTKREKTDLLKTTKFNEDDLPVISYNDKVARCMGLERNDVVKIRRKSESAGRYVCYRICR